MTADDESRSPVELLADEFLDRCHRGERPTVAEYLAAHPDLADDIRELFPALVVLEKADEWMEDYTEPHGVSADGKPIERLGERNPWSDELPAPQMIPSDLVAEGHEIPLGRVAAMHEGKRRARM